MKLNELSRIKSRRPHRRVGRGQGSGRGSHTTGRGAKGQKIRGKVRLYFEGGQLPITKRLPHQKGFKRSQADSSSVLKISDLAVFSSGQKVSPATLRQKGLIGRRQKRVKVIGGGRLTQKLKFFDVAFSKRARDAVIQSGSTVN